MIISKFWSHLSQSDYMVQTFKFYTVPVHMDNVKKTFKPENTFKQTRVNFLYRENMTSFLNYVTATLRALFAWRGSNDKSSCIFFLIKVLIITVIFQSQFMTSFFDTLTAYECL